MIVALSHLVCDNFEKATGIKSYPLKDYNHLQKPIASHADMLLCVIDKTVFCYGDYYDDNKCTFDAIESEGYEIVKVQHACSKEYPNDIGLNALTVGKTIFCKEKNTAKEILTFAKGNGYKVVNVNQGYSCCSTYILNENVAITSDAGMKKALEKEGIEVIFINADKIQLEGYNHGFIGGSGATFEKTAFFFGSIDNLPEYKSISDAIRDNLMVEKSILSGDVCDFGGIKFFHCEK